MMSGEPNKSYKGLTSSALAVLFLAGLAPSLLDGLEHAFAQTVPLAFPLFFDFLLFLFVRGFGWVGDKLKGDSQLGNSYLAGCPPALQLLSC